MRVSYHILSADQYMILYAVPGYIIHVNSYPQAVKNELCDENLYFIMRECAYTFSVIIVDNKLEMIRVGVGLG